MTMPRVGSDVFLRTLLATTRSGTSPNDNTCARAPSGRDAKGRRHAPPSAMMPLILSLLRFWPLCLSMRRIIHAKNREHPNGYSEFVNHLQVGVWVCGLRGRRFAPFERTYYVDPPASLCACACVDIARACACVDIVRACAAERSPLKREKTLIASTCGDIRSALPAKDFRRDRPSAPSTSRPQRSRWKFWTPCLR